MRSKMIAMILKAALFFLVLLILFSCSKIEDDTVKRLPVEYYLTDSQKAIFENFALDTVTFVNEADNKTITFISTEVHDFLTRPESDYRRGEALSLSYISDTDYLPNFSFSYWLEALKDGSCILGVTFYTGTFRTERAHDYKSSHFHLVPFAETKDSLLSGEDWFIYDFKDSLSIGNTYYKDIYHLTSTWHYYYPVVAADCYYQKDRGIVAFTDLWKKKWIIAPGKTSNY